MKRQHVLNCMLSKWYPGFKNITIRSRVISLPKEFIDYLKADSVVLPGENSATANADTDSDNDTDEWQALQEDPDQETARAPEFNEIDSQIKEAINDLGGTVFPKLNWSSPRDASWISLDGTLKCSCPSDVYLLLKSSDLIAADVCESFKHCEDGEGEMVEGFELVLRKWVEISPGMEFRCFVKNHELVAISQRDTTSFYEFIEEYEIDICNDILQFYNKKIAHKFLDGSFVFDVYRRAPGRVLLIDFGPFGAATDPLLFSWGEIVDSVVYCSAEDFGGEFRFICDEAGVQPNPYHRNRMPTDVIDLACGNDVNKLVDFLQVRSLIRRQGSDSDDQH